MVPPHPYAKNWVYFSTHPKVLFKKKKKKNYLQGLRGNEGFAVGGRAPSDVSI